MEVTLFTEHAVYTATLTSKFLSLEIGPADSEELRCFGFFYVVCVLLLMLFWKLFSRVAKRSQLVFFAYAAREIQWLLWTGCLNYMVSFLNKIGNFFFCLWLNTFICVCVHVSVLVYSVTILSALFEHVLLSFLRPIFYVYTSFTPSKSYKPYAHAKFAISCCGDNNKLK